MSAEILDKIKIMKHQLFILLATFYVFQSCRSHVDLDAEKNKIMLLHNEQRQAHMEKNVSLLLKDSITDFIEVNHGIIKKPTISENRKRFQAYFDAVDFVKWDDISPPIFSFSDDATMATTIVDKIVITRRKFEKNQLDTSYYAWMAVYKKSNGNWRLHNICSTNK